MPDIEIDEQFRPTSASVKALFDVVGGFAVPAYQRPYRWAPLDIKRLLEDLVNGLERLQTDPGAVTFLGTIITVSGTQLNHPQPPSEIRQVIDGQQRLTTLLMVAIAIHIELGEVQEKLIGTAPRNDLNPSELVSWLDDQTTEVRQQLLNCLAQTRVTGDPGYRSLPKVIREPIDKWSIKKGAAHYSSPIANLLFVYASAARANEEFVLSMPTHMLMPEALGSAIEDHEFVHTRFRQIRKYIKEIAKGSPRELPDSLVLEELLKPSSRLIDGLFVEQVEDIRSRLLSFSQERQAASSIRLLFLARFLLDHVAITQINARNEHYAFDLFDSLNTTGEPLTAFETFLPLVVEKEGHSEYQGSPSAIHMSTVSKLLGGRDGDVQRETARLITSFMLADAGLKVPNRHNEQRRDLTSRYKSASNQDERRAMTEQLSDSAIASFEIWKDRTLPAVTDVRPASPLETETQFVVKFVESTKHTILIAPLSRYYSAYRKNASPESQRDLEKVIKGMVAFSVLWRAYKGGTAGIDSEYRRLMQSGVNDVLGPLSRTGADDHMSNPLPSADELLRGLRIILEQPDNPGTDRDRWTQVVHRQPLYDSQPELARFLLLISSHHAVPQGTTGLTQDGTFSMDTDMLRPERWSADSAKSVESMADSVKSVEHIAPQNPNLESGEEQWPNDIYTVDNTIVHRLGNLTLVPMVNNSQLGNKSWVAKQFIYKALSASSVSDTKRHLEDASNAGVSLTPAMRDDVVKSRAYLPLLESVALYGGNWNADFIEERGKHLCGRAWDVLDGWLAGH